MEEDYKIILKCFDPSIEIEDNVNMPLITEDNKLFIETILKLITRQIYYNGWNTNSLNEALIVEMLRKIQLYDFKNETEMEEKTKIDYTIILNFFKNIIK